MTKTAKFVLTRKQDYIEEIGSINEKIEELKARKELLAHKLEKYPGKSLGLCFQANVFLRDQSNLDAAKVRRFLGDAKYEKCLRHKEITIVSVRRIT